MNNLNFADFYWQIGDDKTRVYSSKRNAFVPADDADFVAWQGDVGQSHGTIISSVAEIAAYVRPILPAWLFVGDEFVQPAPGQYSPGQLINYAWLRWEAVSTGGIRVQLDTNTSVEASTTPAAMGLLNAAVMVASVNPNAATPWVEDNGTTHILDAADVQHISNVVTQFISATFATMADATVKIKNGGIKAPADVDALSWPANS
jgi:hypothetical protein